MLTVSATKEIPCILQNLEDHHCVQNPPMVPILRLDIPVHSRSSYFFSDQF